MVYPDLEEEPEGTEWEIKKPRPLDYVVSDEEIDPNAPADDEESTYDYFRNKAGMGGEQEPSGAFPTSYEQQQQQLSQEELQQEQKIQHISFYYPTSGGTVELAAGDTQIDFTEGTVALPGSGSDSLSSRLTGSNFGGICALFIVADKSFVININGVAKMTVQKNFKKKHINIQRIVLTCASATNFLIWASTDPDADFEKDITEVTIGGGVAPFGGTIDSGSFPLDTNTWSTIAFHIITQGSTYRLTKAQVQCGSAAWGCVLMGAATVAVWRIPDDGYWVDWFPYGDGVKIVGTGTNTISIKGKSKASPVDAFGVLVGEEIA